MNKFQASNRTKLDKVSNNRMEKYGPAPSLAPAALSQSADVPWVWKRFFGPIHNCLTEEQ